MVESWHVPATLSIWKTFLLLMPAQAGVAYHDMAEVPEQGPGAFSLTLKHSVVFRLPASGEAEGGSGVLPSLLQTHVAARVDAALWNSSFTKTVWSVKWTANGLGPVRPHVVFTAPVTIAVGRAVMIQ